MGWGHKFPTVRQLNALTKSRTNRQDTKSAFEHFFDDADPNKEYKLGELCRQWGQPVNVSTKAGRPSIKSPPWERGPFDPGKDYDPSDDREWNQEDADAWAAHCQDEIDEATRKELECWIKEAIKNDVRIIYRFVRAPGQTSYTAEKFERSARRWLIKVKGPGFEPEPPNPSGSRATSKY